MENGLQGAEKQASKEALAPVQVQDDGGSSGGTRSEMLFSKETRKDMDGKWE